MRHPGWPKALGVAWIAGATVLLAAQNVPQTTSPFRLYLLGREVGKETATLSLEAGGTRRLDATVSYTDRGSTVRLTATLDAGVDWSPRHLVVHGQPFRDGSTDLEVTVDRGRATVRDRTVVTTLDIGTTPYFPLDGAGPVGLQEQLVRYWRSHGRPREILSTPSGPIHIETRADEQIEVSGKSATLERLSIDGPAWGHETAWVGPGGDLAALTTWAGWLPFMAVREGFESRIERFLDEAARDRVGDLDRLTDLSMPDQPEGVVLTGATVISGGKRPPIPDAVVVIRDGRIVALGPKSRTRAPADVPTLDVSGMTIVAGLWDMQAQISQVESVPAYLGSGVTTVRNIVSDSTSPWMSRQSGPQGRALTLSMRMLFAGLVDGGPAGLGTVPTTSADEARDSIRRYRVDPAFRQIEMGGGVSAAALRAVAAEAHRFLMVVSGAAPSGLTTGQALDAGLDQLEGLPREASDAAGIATVVAQLAQHHTIVVPLAAWNDLLRSSSASPVSAFQAEFSRAPAPLSRTAMSLASGASASEPPSAVAFIRAARAAGVPMVAGTNGGLPGFSLQRELQLFVEAGMTPLEALQSATSLPAQLMKQEDVGIVDAGKRADLLVLTANPLDDISNLGKIKWVVTNGRLYDGEKLRKAAGFRE